MLEQNKEYLMLDSQSMAKTSNVIIAGNGIQNFKYVGIVSCTKIRLLGQGTSKVSVTFRVTYLRHKQSKENCVYNY